MEDLFWQQWNAESGISQKYKTISSKQNQSSKAAGKQHPTLCRALLRHWHRLCSQVQDMPWIAPLKDLAQCFSQTLFTGFTVAQPWDITHMDSGAATIVCAQLDTSKGRDAPVCPDSQSSHLQRWLRVLPCEQIAVLRQDLLSKHTPCVLQGKSTRLEGSTLWKKSATKTSEPKHAGGFGLLPDVFFYLGLCLKIERVSWIESDPLLLPPGSVLLLFQQHPGEFLCSNKERQKCFLLEITLYKSSSGTASTSFYASTHSGIESVAQAQQASSGGTVDEPQKDWLVANLGICWDEKQLDRVISPTQTHRDTVKLNFPLHILFCERKMEEKSSWDNNT